MKKNTTLKAVMAHLYAVADPEKAVFKAKKFGIITNNAIGVYQKELNRMARELKKDRLLAIALFDTGVYEARLLCSKIFHPKDLTNELLEKWVATFDNWAICDSFCMGLIAKSDFALPKIKEWVLREEEFEKRAGFAIIAAYCMADKKASNEVYEQFFPMIINAANDDRIYVKKAVNWALRSIGKRNVDLNKSALNVAKEILLLESKSAKWIANDAIRELEGTKVNILDYPRHIYRK